MDLAEEECPPVPRAPVNPPGFVETLRACQEAVRVAGEAAGVDPALFGNRAQLESFIRLTPGERGRSPLFRGWRREFAGERVAAVIDGAHPGAPVAEAAGGGTDGPDNG